MDPATLASTIVGKFLFPYVKVGAEKLVEEFKKKMDDATAKHAAGLAKKAWDRVKAAFSEEKDQGTLEQFEQYPDAAKPLVEAVLTQRLEQDAQLKKDLTALVDEKGPDGQSTGAQIMNAGIAGILDARGADFSHAQGLTLAGAMFTTPPPEPPKPPKSDSSDETS